MIPLDSQTPYDLITTPDYPNGHTPSKLMSTVKVVSAVRELNQNKGETGRRTPVSDGIQLNINAYTPLQPSSIEGWYAYKGVDASGFQGLISVNPTKGVVNVSFGGTDPSGLNPLCFDPKKILTTTVHIANDVGIASGTTPDLTMSQSSALVEKAHQLANILGYTVEYGGHSMGASIGLVHTVKDHGKAILMDSANNKKMIEFLRTKPEFSHATEEWLKENVITIQGSPNLINSSGEPVGQVIHVQSLPESQHNQGLFSSVVNTLEAHSAQNIQKGYMALQDSTHPGMPNINFVAPTLPNLSTEGPVSLSPLPPVSEPVIPSIATQADSWTKSNIAAFKHDNQKKIAAFLTPNNQKQNCSSGVEVIKERRMQEIAGKLYQKNDNSNGLVYGLTATGIAISFPISGPAALIGAAATCAAAFGYWVYSNWETPPIDAQIHQKLDPLDLKYKEAKSESAKVKSLHKILKKAEKLSHNIPEGQGELKTSLDDKMKLIARLLDKNAPKIPYPATLDQPAQQLNQIATEADAVALDAAKTGNIDALKNALKNPDMTPAVQSQLEKHSNTIYNATKATADEVLEAAHMMEEVAKDKAIDLLQQKNRQEPGNKKLAECLYQHHLDNKDIDAADKVLEDYRKLNKTDAEMAYKHASVLEKKGDEAAKERLMRDIVEMDEKNPENAIAIKAAKEWCDEVDRQRKNLEDSRIAEEHNQRIEKQNRALAHFDAVREARDLSAGYCAWGQFALGHLSHMAEGYFDKSQVHRKAACIIAPVIGDIISLQISNSQEAALKEAANMVVESGRDNPMPPSNTNYFATMMQASLVADRLLRNYDKVPDFASYDATIGAIQVAATSSIYTSDATMVYNAVVACLNGPLDPLTITTGVVGVVDCLSTGMSLNNSSAACNGDYVQEGMLYNVAADLRYITGAAKLGLTFKAATAKAATAAVGFFGLPVVATTGAVGGAIGLHLAYKRYFTDGWYAKVIANARIAISRKDYDRAVKNITELKRHIPEDKDLLFMESKLSYLLETRSGRHLSAFRKLKSHAIRYKIDLDAWKTLADDANKAKIYMDSILAHQHLIQELPPEASTSRAESHLSLARIASMHRRYTFATQHLPQALDAYATSIKMAEEDYAKLSKKIGLAEKPLQLLHTAIQNTPQAITQPLGVNQATPIVHRSAEAERLSLLPGYIQSLKNRKSEVDEFYQFVQSSHKNMMKESEGKLASYPTFFPMATVDAMKKLQNSVPIKA